jgi:small subunit ribosomal protein S3
MKKVMEKACWQDSRYKSYVCRRLGGAEIARTEWLKEGRIPLQTFRAEIDSVLPKLTLQWEKSDKSLDIQERTFPENRKELLEEAKLVENVENVEAASAAEESK